MEIVFRPFLSLARREGIFGLSASVGETFSKSFNKSMRMRGLRTRLSGAPRPTAVLPSVPLVAGHMQNRSNRPAPLPHMGGKAGTY